MSVTVCDVWLPFHVEIWVERHSRFNGIALRRFRRNLQPRLRGLDFRRWDFGTGSARLSQEAFLSIL
jgi:hypothetical protein